jgi:hypothetical protein
MWVKVLVDLLAGRRPLLQVGLFGWPQVTIWVVVYERQLPLTVLLV